MFGMLKPLTGFSVLKDEKLEKSPETDRPEREKSKLNDEEYGDYIYWVKMSKIVKDVGMYIDLKSKNGLMLGFNCYKLSDKIKKIWEESLKKSKKKNVKNK